jgi:hypothetical protein
MCFASKAAADDLCRTIALNAMYNYLTTVTSTNSQSGFKQKFASALDQIHNHTAHLVAGAKYSFLEMNGDYTEADLNSLSAAYEKITESSNANAASSSEVRKAIGSEMAGVMDDCVKNEQSGLKVTIDIQDSYVVVDALLLVPGVPNAAIAIQGGRVFKNLDHCTGSLSNDPASKATEIKSLVNASVRCERPGISLVPQVGTGTLWKSPPADGFIPTDARPIKFTLPPATLAPTDIFTASPGPNAATARDLKDEFPFMIQSSLGPSEIGFYKFRSKVDARLKVLVQGRGKDGSLGIVRPKLMTDTGAFLVRISDQEDPLNVGTSYRSSGVYDIAKDKAYVLQLDGIANAKNEYPFDVQIIFEQ